MTQGNNSPAEHLAKDTGARLEKENGMTDPIQNAIQYSLRSLSERARITHSNLANVNTPGYLAKQTDFESSLAKAIAGKGAVSLRSNLSTSLAPTNVNGNNVDIDNETLKAMDTQLRYQAMVQAMNEKFRLLRTAIGA